MVSTVSHLEPTALAAAKRPIIKNGAKVGLGGKPTIGKSMTGKSTTAKRAPGKRGPQM